MGAYDFNTPRYRADAIIEELRKELRNIVVDSQTSINDVKMEIAYTEKLLKQLKNTVDNLPDYTVQYNEINAELEKLKKQMQTLIDNPVELEYIVLNLEEN